MKLKDKIVVITGSSRGLGKALAFGFAKEGARIVFVGRNERELLENAENAGGFAVACDITDGKDVKELTKKVIDKYGKIDIWINNAGVWLPHMPIEEVNSERAKKLFDVNVFGLIHCSKEALIQMRKQESGIIVNILSTIALGASATEAVYCASKWAANGFTQSLRLAASPHSVKVLTVFPGGMKTNFFDEAKPDQYEDFMNPDDVARKIIDNIKLEEPEEELILRRPKK